MGLRRPDRDPVGLQAAIVPAPARSTRPLRDWAVVEVADEHVEIELHGWRSLAAVRRRLRVPLQAVTSVAHAPGVYGLVATSLRPRARARSHVYRLGVYRGWSGWSFWACGLGRGAVIIETDSYRFRYVVVEVSDPPGLVRRIEAALAARRGRDGGPAADGERPGTR